MSNAADGSPSAAIRMSASSACVSRCRWRSSSSSSAATHSARMRNAAKRRASAAVPTRARCSAASDASASCVSAACCCGSLKAVPVAINACSHASTARCASKQRAITRASAGDRRDVHTSTGTPLVASRRWRCAQAAGSASCGSAATPIRSQPSSAASAPGAASSAAGWPAPGWPAPGWPAPAIAWDSPCARAAASTFAPCSGSRAPDKRESGAAPGSRNVTRAPTARASSSAWPIASMPPGVPSTVTSRWRYIVPLRLSGERRAAPRAGRYDVHGQAPRGVRHVSEPMLSMRCRCGPTRRGGD
ncbi:hypothetical protein Bcep18194_A4839 [Burkholderia lata]|uniref:Uncharacterized protein n=1 Tax=Burkholderia lata (strain ATCC 17760 / DSM 23089 / LMG 22485 / NCIMB 9086 / R18194 / 383) TaxID=482957 RepID=Q39GI2_BURL3|nr:hypothetical protein Bcep18194_A4839 [Burkholderia lata]